jgi:hypothetical protein
MPPSTPAASFFSTSTSALLAALVALAAAGCGAAEPPQAKVSGGATSPFTDADSALAELSRAESEISSLLGPAPASQAVAPVPPAASAAPAEPGPQGPTAVVQAEATSKRAEHVSDQPATDACSIACRALASMDRAATHLCGLAGEGDPSCTGARARVKNATDRVSARCPCTP